MKNTNRDFVFYLDAIKEMDCEFDKFEAFETRGGYPAPYPYQWLATTKHREGEDDVHEGKGGTPIEAIRNLYKSVKQEWENPYNEE